MSNRKYANSARRETELKTKLERQGYFAIRASGSHGIADVVGISPLNCGHCTCPDVFQVRFIQIKTSQEIHGKKVVIKSEEVPFGFVNVEYHYFPVKNDKYWENYRKRKQIKDKTK